MKQERNGTTLFPTSAATIKQFIRGVNLGGWLVLERYITPYLFILTTCDLEGNFQYFANQIDAPWSTSTTFSEASSLNQQRNSLHIHLENFTSFEKCPLINSTAQIVDEWSLVQSFPNRQIASKYLEIHYDHFITREDILALKQHGVTHVRVPLPHWILYRHNNNSNNDESTHDDSYDEPYLSSQGWKYFQRFITWCRELQIQVWPDLHTAPGSQNGFDNSGHLGSTMTCQGWDDGTTDTPTKSSNLPRNVQQTLDILHDITLRIQQDQMTDVITGFGLLNEPFSDCSMEVVREFYNQGLNIVRTNMGPSTHVYIGDMFDSGRWNDGFWSDPTIYNGTYLDSHIYQSFEVHTRGLSPKQHVALVCQRDHVDVVQCCYDKDGLPSRGLQRIFTEWSASFDQSVGDQVPALMESIVSNQGIADQFHRTLSLERRDFLRHFIQAQMVSYEALDAPIESAGWFFWNIKMEGGIFAEWDFLRGVREGWMPIFPPSTVPSQHVFGNCYDILNETVDDWNVIDEIPKPTEYTLSNEGSPITDDVVLSHGSNLRRRKDNGEWTIIYPSYYNGGWGHLLWVSTLGCLGFVLAILLLYFYRRKHREYTHRGQYMTLDDMDMVSFYTAKKEPMKHVDTVTGMDSWSSSEDE